MPLQILDFFNSLPGGKEVSAAALFLVLTVIFFIAIKIIFFILSFLAKKTKTTLDDEIVKQTKKFFYYIGVLTALYLSISAYYPNTEIEGVQLGVLYILSIMVISAFWINGMIDVVLIWYANEIMPIKKNIQTKNVFPFVRNVIKIIIYLVFVIAILGKLGIEVVPLIAGLGIIGLAVALALQDTLANFFAGLYILADKPFNEGDYIRLENGMEGTVSTIGWRTTKIIMPQKNEVIVPNSKLTRDIIVNYHPPSRIIGVVGEIDVSYKNDAKRVEVVILEALKLVQKKNPKMLSDEPWIRLDKFGKNSLIFKYGYLVKNFESQASVSNDVNTAILYSLKKNKIIIFS